TLARDGRDIPASSPSRRRPARAAGDSAALSRVPAPWATLLLGLVLAAATVAVYAPVGAYGFVNLDDPPYVAANAIVSRGLTGEGMRWAFTTGYAGNWHPLTWLSHMLDVQLFGLDAGAHHVASLALHVSSTLLLFALLVRLTGARGRSAFVAALFALHPL